MNGTMVLLLNAPGIGGAEQVVETLGAEFVGRGLDLSVVSLEPGSSMRNLEPEALAGSAATMPGRLGGLLTLAASLKRRVARDGLWLVQSHMYRANYVNVVARLFGARHRVQLVNHGMPSNYRGQGLKGWVNRFLVRCLYPRADQVICPSRAMLEELRALGVPSGRLRLIPNPVPLAEIRRLAQAAPPPALPADYVVSIGRMVPAKRMTDTVVALARSRRDPAPRHLVLIGEGPERSRIEAVAEEWGVRDRVHLLGRLENPYPVLAGARCLVSASASEGFSLVIVHALALGVPVVSTDCPGGPREILAGPDGDCGLLVEVGDTDALADAMGRVASDPEWAREMGDRGRRRAEDYDAACVADLYLAAIRELGAN